MLALDDMLDNLNGKNDEHLGSASTFCATIGKETASAAGEKCGVNPGRTNVTAASRRRRQLASEQAQAADVHRDCSYLPLF